MDTGGDTVTVRGGSGGVVAHADEMRHVAGEFGATARHLAGTAAALQAITADPELALTAALDPIGWARVEAALTDAASMPGGLLSLATDCAETDGELRAAAAAYVAVDRLDENFHDMLTGLRDAPAAIGAGVSALVTSGRPGAALGSALAADPRLADAAAVLPPIAMATGLAARVLPDGRGEAVRTGTDRHGVAGRPPRRMSDIVADLARRNRDERHGEIDVRVLTMRDGSRRAIVDITGTKSWTPLPTADVTSLTTDARALAGLSGAYEQGVLAAMRDAGVRPDEPVLLVGHSEGGMVAVTTARDALAARRFRVTHVITAGSPVAGTVGSLPAGVRVLALENSRDVVPHLDGAMNPDGIGVVTVTGSSGPGDSVAGDHHIETAYLPLARAVDHDRNASVREFVASARGFLTARSVATHTYQVRRQ